MCAGGHTRPLDPHGHTRVTCRAGHGGQPPSAPRASEAQVPRAAQDGPPVPRRGGAGAWVGGRAKVRGPGCRGGRAGSGKQGHMGFSGQGALCRRPSLTLSWPQGPRRPWQLLFPPSVTSSTPGVQRASSPPAQNHITQAQGLVEETRVVVPGLRAGTGLRRRQGDRPLRGTVTHSLAPVQPSPEPPSLRHPGHPAPGHTGMAPRTPRPQRPPCPLSTVCWHLRGRGSVQVVPRVSPAGRALRAARR